MKRSIATALSERMLFVTAIGGIVFYGVTGMQALWNADADVATVAITIGLSVVLLALSVIDVETLRLPDVLTLPLIVAGIGASTYLVLDDAWMRAAAAAAGFLSLFLVAEIFRRVRGVDALGLGDAKLFAAAGAWVGFDGLPSVLLLASVTALAVVVGLMAASVAIGRDTRVPFGPFLAAGMWLVWLHGPSQLW